MLFTPKKSKFKKYHKGKLSNFVGKPRSLYSISSGSVILQSIGSGRVTIPQLEACRKTLRKSLKRRAEIHFHIHPTVPITRKPSEVRMGKGKGAFSEWVVPISSGTTLLQIKSSQFKPVIKVLHIVQRSFPFSTKIVLSK
jgi:large subunit ribosomal protein L16